MFTQKKLALFFLVFLALFFSASGVDSASDGSAKLLGYRVLRTLPHDTSHFTQGLVYEGKRLYESAGGYGSSALHEIDLESGRSLRSVQLPGHIFAEGLAALGSELLQLTWRNQVGFIYDRSLREVRRFRYSGEGWGLTRHGSDLVMSDGSADLRWLDARSFERIRSLRVHDRGKPVALLNELESARGHLYANVWKSDRIAVIDPDDGGVAAWLDLSGLRSRFRKPAGWNAQEHVLNGIAYDADKELFYLTGKCWPVLFEVEIDPVGK